MSDSVKSRDAYASKNLISALLIDTSDFFNVSELENRDFRFKGGKPEKNKENEKVALIHGETFSFSSFFSFFPTIKSKNAFFEVRDTKKP